NYTLGYFQAARRNALGGRGLPYGVASEGNRCGRVVCPRTADTIAEAMNSLARKIPWNARISMLHVPVPDGVLGTMVCSEYAALRVASQNGGLDVAIELAWEEA